MPRPAHAAAADSGPADSPPTKKTRRPRKRTGERDEAHGQVEFAEEEVVEDGEKMENEEVAGENQAQPRLLAIHITRERDGIVLIGAATLEGGTLLILGRTVAWVGDVPFILQLILDLTKPVSRVVMSSKTDEWITECVQNTIKEGGLGALAIQTSSSFDFEQSVQRLRSALNDEQTDALGSLLDLSNRASVGAIGGLLVASAKKGSDEALKISGVNLFDLGSFMLMDSASMRALDFSRLEEHPSVIRGRGRPKEGFSLLTLLNRARTSMGASLLRRWLSRPLTNLQDIAARHDAIDFLLGSSELCAVIAKGLKCVHDLPRALLRIKACTAHVTDWIVFAESLVSVELVLVNLGRQLDLATSPAFLVDIADAATTDLTAVLRLLDMIDWNETRARGRVVPNVGSDEALDAARRRLAGLDGVLDAETVRLRGSNAGCRWTMRCIPTLGFVVAIDAQDKAPPAAEGFELQFAAQRLSTEEDADSKEEAGLVRYFKNARAKQLDILLGDVAAEVVDHEQRIVRSIEARVVEMESSVLLASHRAAELDAILSFAEVARDFDYCRPKLCHEPITQLRGAMHPLLSRTVDRFVPVDVDLGASDKSPLLVVTGPNFSGKSVVLKTVAMIHAMAQMGSFVPCTSARLGIVDRIFTRVSSLESVSQAGIQEESSFSIDVQQVALMLNACTPNSLLIVDEFGKGTNTRDGAALLGSVIHHLLAGSCGPTPRSLFSTHLVEMFDAKLVSCRVAEMKVEFDEDQNVPEPLFRMEENGKTAEESYGIACARRASVPEPVLQRAHQISERISLKLPLVMAKAGCEGVSAASVLHSFARVKNWSLASSEQVEALLRDIEFVAKDLNVLG